MKSQQAGFNIGLIAFLANLMREISTFVFGPMLVKYSCLAPIALGGASTMDTTLSVIKQISTEEITLLAFINGVILSFIVPALLFIIYVVL
ncbi:MAG: LysO family transporter [Bacillota bacterium]|nr:LysO family transporter [Bacillota bacterium]